MNRLSKSGIEYIDYAWNFYSGCRHKQQGKCPPGFKCWAESITERFGSHYPNGFKPTFYPEALLSPLSLRKPSRIGVAFMGDLFGDWMNPLEKFEANMPSGKASVSMSLKGWIFTTIKQCPHHTFVFLTKNTAGLIPWSPFPDNCEVGFSACDYDMARAGCSAMQKVEAKVKFISFEPLLGHCELQPSTFALAGIDWFIIGGQSSPRKMPDIGWVKYLADMADFLKIPLFLKNNLGWPQYSADGSAPFYKKHETWQLRQELPRPAI